MSSKLQQNNTALELLLNKINSLPEAGGTKEPVLQDKTVMPAAGTQIINADAGYDGLKAVTIEGDNDLVVENIKIGTNIFGVEGTFTKLVPTVIKPADLDIGGYTELYVD